MMKFKSLVEVIHQSVEAALQAVASTNIDFFTQYFTPPTSSSESDNSRSEPRTSGGMEPRVLKLQMLKATAKGVVPHEVAVPLISLVPYSSLQASEISFEIDLECVEKDGEMLVAFPQVRRTLLGNDQIIAIRKNARLSIKLAATDRVAGVSAIIESYDKLLRAQLPS